MEFLSQSPLAPALELPGQEAMLQQGPHFAACYPPPLLPVCELPPSEVKPGPILAGPDGVRLVPQDSPQADWLEDSGAAKDPVTGATDPFAQWSEPSLPDPVPWDVLYPPGWREPWGVNPGGEAPDLSTWPFDGPIVDDPFDSSVLPDPGHGMPLPRQTEPNPIFPSMIWSWSTAAEGAPPVLLAYQEFREQNPGWSSERNQGKAYIALFLPSGSEREPGILFGSPFSASEFDAWYDQYWASRDHLPSADLPQPQKPSPAPSQAPVPWWMTPDPGYRPLDDYSDAGSKEHPLYFEFQNFLAQNPDWRRENVPQIGTCAITRSRLVPTVLLSGSAEAYAFDVWYIQTYPPVLNPPVAGPCFPTECPALPTIDPTVTQPLPDSPSSISSEPSPNVSSPGLSQPDDLSEQPVVEPVAALSAVSRSGLAQAQDQDESLLTEPIAVNMEANLVLWSLDSAASDDRLSTAPAPQPSVSSGAPEDLLEPRKSIDLPYWLPLHLRG